MKEWDSSVMFHRKKSVGHGDIDPFADTHQFGDEEMLVLGAADVLKNGIRRDNVERPIAERQRLVGGDLAILDLRERNLEGVPLS